jgi:hypothetical protein
MADIWQLSPEESFEVVCHHDGFTHRGADHLYYPSTLVIAVDGAFKDNGSPSATASHGIYVGEENTSAGRWNECRKVRGKATSQRAELMAGIRA